MKSSWTPLLTIAHNSERRKRQRELDIQVIIGNPPYSAGQGNANDDNANIGYPGLDARIRETYAAHTAMTNKRAIYDSYIRAIRWGSDRLGDSGVLAYVTNAGWVDGAALDGLRKCLAEEFTSIYVFHLRGNARTSGEQRRKESGNIFGEGSRAPVAITLFIKNPNAEQQGQIFFHDIGDYLTRQDKLNIVRSFGSIKGVKAKDGWQLIEPNEHYDWINQRSQSYNNLLNITAKDGDPQGIFTTHSAGLKTNRDAWVYDFSKKALETRTKQAVDFFNDEIERKSISNSFKVNSDPHRFKWCQATLRDLERGREMSYHPEVLQQTIYRPFQKMWVYKHKSLNWSSYLMPKFYPTAEAENRLISVSGLGETSDFTVMMVNFLPDLHALKSAQHFPLKLYEKSPETDENDLFAGQSDNTGYTVRDGITDEGLKHFQTAYPAETITKEDIFYYVYGLLHSPIYRETFADNLSKELPRIPAVKKPEDFWHFVRAGQDLGELHINYETVEPYPVVVELLSNLVPKRSSCGG